MALLFIIVWIVCAVACASIASSKGHSGCLWGLLGLVFGFFALLVIAVMPSYRPVGPVEVMIRHEAAPQQAAKRKGPPLLPYLAAESERIEREQGRQVRHVKKCPDCAENVLVDARVCRHCGYRFDGKGETKAIEQVRPRFSFDADQVAAATVLRALGEAASPLLPLQATRIAQLVAQMHGWGKVGGEEAREVAIWVGSPVTDQAGLRPALERVAKWSPRWTGPLLAAADDIVVLGRDSGHTGRQVRFLGLVKQIAGSKA